MPIPMPSSWFSGSMPATACRPCAVAASTLDKSCRPACICLLHAARSRPPSLPSATSTASGAPSLPSAACVPSSPPSLPRDPGARLMGPHASWGARPFLVLACSLLGPEGVAAGRPPARAWPCDAGYSLALLCVAIHRGETRPCPGDCHVAASATRAPVHRTGHAEKNAPLTFCIPRGKSCFFSFLKKKHKTKT